MRARRNIGGSAVPHSSRAECIDSWATPTSTVPMPRRAAVTGPMVDPHGRSVRVTKSLHGNARRLARPHEHRGGGGVGGVALVAVDLDHRPAVHDHHVVRLVTLEVVRVHGVGHVGRRAHGAGHRAVQGLAIAAPGQDRPLDDGGQHRPIGPGGRLAADLLVVEQAHRGWRGRRSERSVSANAVMAAHDEQRLSRRPEASSSPSTPRTVPGCEVVGHDVPCHDVVAARRRARSARNRRKPSVVGCAETPHRRQVQLRVEQQPLGVDLTIEVDGQLGDPQQRPVDQQQPLLGGATGPHDHPPRQAEVSVEPRVEQGAAVDLDARADASRRARCPVRA